MKHILIISYFLTAISSFAGEALGVKYDQLYLVRLKVSHKKVDHKDLLVIEGKQPKIALETFKVGDSWAKRIDKIFPKDGNYDNGTADSRMQLYSLVFYKEGKVVLSISPNLLGSDLYASNRKGYHSISGKQKEDLLQTLFFIMGRCEKQKLP